jgi:hypothetical protein
MSSNENVTPVNLSQSFCSVDESSPECVDGVCSIAKRKMKSPNSSPSNKIPQIPQIPQLDQLFSKLFSSVLHNTENNQDGKCSKSISPKTPKTSDADADTDSVESASASDNSDDDECNDPNCNTHVDYRWEAVNKLLESHVNLTRVVTELVRNK